MNVQQKKPLFFLCLLALLEFSPWRKPLVARQISSQQQASANEPGFNPAHIARTYTAHSGVQLDELLLQFQSTYLTPINYEEVRYENTNELVSKDVISAAGPRHLLFPRRSDFSVTITANQIKPIDAVEYLLDQHKNARLAGSGAYQALVRQNHIDVWPYQALGANGSWHQVIPAMSNTISFPEETYSLSEVIDMLASQISSATGNKVLVVQEPNGTFKTVIGAKSISPGDLLDQLGSNFHSSLSYHLRYDPTNSNYLLSIYMAGDPKTYGNLKNNTTPSGVNDTQPKFPSLFKKEPAAPTQPQAGATTPPPKSN